ncbi:MAG: hypothetical protein A2W25_04685 [candidate division Zixibacteria bacterium RBG_16_53_22]|nr:MAG: hypothetical protein A2W25_04685 [candidate division Zixibacteria bacterium RBG_16_53_22]
MDDKAKQPEKPDSELDGISQILVAGAVFGLAIYGLYKLLSEERKRGSDKAESGLLDEMKRSGLL